MAGAMNYCHLHNTNWSGLPRCPSCPDESPSMGMRPGYDYRSTIDRINERRLVAMRARAREVHAELRAAIEQYDAGKPGKARETTARVMRAIEEMMG